MRLSVFATPLLPLPPSGSRWLMVAALILVSWASTTALQVPAAEHIGDKLMHGLTFAVLAAVAHAGFPTLRGLLTALPLLLGYGLVIELVQATLPYRRFDLLDWLADALGLLAYLLINGFRCLKPAPR